MNVKYSHAESRLLRCGVFVAPVFYLLALVQLAIRPDYDIRRLPLSFLSLGHLGWIQSVNFLVTGALALFCALGIRTRLLKQRGGVVLPLLIGLFGVGMVAAGIFGPDPLPGNTGSNSRMTVTGMMHMAAFLVAFWSLIGASFITAWRLAKQSESSWATYSALSGLLTPVLVALAMGMPAFAGLIIAGAGLVLFGWLSVMAAHMRRTASAPTPEATGLALRHS